MRVMSVMLPWGLPSDSTKIALVFASISGSNDSGRRWSAKRVWMPYCGSVCANRFQVPPYSALEETMLSPASAIVRIE